MTRITIADGLAVRLDTLARDVGIRRARLVNALLGSMLDALTSPVRPTWRLALLRPDGDGSAIESGLGRILGDHPTWRTEPAELPEGEAGPLPCDLVRDDGTRVVVRWSPASNTVQLEIPEPPTDVDHEEAGEAGLIEWVPLERGEAWVDLSRTAWGRVMAAADRLGARAGDAMQADRGEADDGTA